MDEDQFNMNIRKFLKKVVITSQRNIEEAIRQAQKEGALEGNETLNITATISIDSLNMNFDIGGEIALD